VSALCQQIFGRHLHIAYREAAYALWFAYYNWCRKHQSMGMTPAMRHGVADHPWTIEELLQ
jgi:hypothetical protein